MEEKEIRNTRNKKEVGGGGAPFGRRQKAHRTTDLVEKIPQYTSQILQ